MKGTLLSAALLLATSAHGSSPAPYGVATERAWLTMPDGVRLSVTYYKPTPMEPGRRFPVLFEFLPYRKDDMFLARDWELFAYFVRRGYVIAKVDVRGTGSSEGAVPEREYSEREMQDGLEILRQLASAPWSTGKIGMFGISWGGFNAIQLAMRNPPELKAILAADASDDLFHDDVHYIDGILHLDEYHLSVFHESGLPAPPDYRVDESFFQERFERAPWQAVYLRHQSDGEFWRRGSLRTDYSRLKIPAYLIGGLLDGYRDSVPRMLANASALVKGEIGPWNHAWPDNGTPGPNYEWRERAVRWWDRWLKDEKTGVESWPKLTYFLRDGHRPDATLKTTPGSWRAGDWPIPETRWLTLYPNPEGTLRPSPPGASARDVLAYRPEIGGEAGYWWGESTGDMSPLDQSCLTYTSAPLDRDIELVGFPRVQLRAGADAPALNWAVRLEEVRPDGTIALVTGAALNGLHRRSSAAPEPLSPGALESLSLDLHFTTWRFRKDSRIRLAVSNGLFPMLWPTPHPTFSTLALSADTRLELPILPPGLHPKAALAEPEPREPHPFVRSTAEQEYPHGYRVFSDPQSGAKVVEATGSERFSIGSARYARRTHTRHDVDPKRPADAGFLGVESDAIDLPGRRLELETRLEVRSDMKSFVLRYERKLLENGLIIRTLFRSERIAREDGGPGAITPAPAAGRKPRALPERLPQARPAPAGR
ncbi:MAG: CocE/NonD family hydrolase [Elusimicrobia bacterium]|nr:CocE/NonD family hydrolase [Elusimicrobiota bacterium]